MCTGSQATLETHSWKLVLSPSSFAASVRRFVVAGTAAGCAVKEAVGAEAHVDLGLAEHAVFFATAVRFRPLTLGADDAAYAWFRRHGWSLVRQRPGRNVTEVTRAGLRCEVSGLRENVDFDFPET